MNAAELRTAMRLGSKHPRESRPRNDLGRFGLGLKTASFSQCRQLTVVTRQSGHQNAWQWDLDVVAHQDAWILLPITVEKAAALPAIAELQEHGTYVLWSKLDRLDLGGDEEQMPAMLNGRVDSVRKHLSLVFHRFLAGEAGLKKVDICINRAPLEPFDPFNSRSLSGHVLPEESITVEGETVRVQAYTLPHHSMVAPDEYEKLAGEEGYLKNQGFYVYRNCRLIIYGTWFRMARITELTKLARVKVDIPNTLDHLWTLDVRKSRAIPPEILRRRLRQIVEQICNGSRRPYTHRGTVIANRQTKSVWVRRIDRDGINYQVDLEHPIIDELRMDLTTGERRRLDAILRMIGAAFPAPQFFNDFANEPNRIDQRNVKPELLQELLTLILAGHTGLSREAFLDMVSGLEPFASNQETTKQIVPKLIQEN
jgi:hypothetical protein